VEKTPKTAPKVAVFWTSLHMVKLHATYRVDAMKLSRGDGVALIDPVNAPNFLHKEMISPDLQLRNHQLPKNTLKRAFSQRLKGKTRVKVDSESPGSNFTNQTIRLGIKASEQLHCNPPCNLS
jgi:hypothetical protein